MEYTLTNLQVSNSYRVLRQLGNKDGLKAPVLIFLATNLNVLEPLYRAFEDVRINLVKRYGVMVNPATAEYTFADPDKRILFDIEFDELCKETVNVVTKPAKLERLLDAGLDLAPNDLQILNWLVEYGPDYTLD